MKIKYAIIIALAFGLLAPRSYSQFPCTGQPLDVLFVVDATSSMREELAALPQNLQYFKTLWADADLHTGGLVFRDQMERFIYRDYPIKPGIDSTWHFLTAFPAVGGGDDAEPLNSMLIQSTRFEWRENAKKVVFFLSDAPPRHPGQTEEVIGSLQTLGIRVFTLSPASSGPKALAWQQEVAETTGGLALSWEDPYWHEAALDLVCPRSEETIAEEIARAAIKIYPNPAVRTTTIEAAGPIRVWDNQGRLLFEGENMENPSLTLDLIGWAPGLYWVQVENGNMGKLVVIE